jgi:hypothetical protein
MSKYHEDFL